MVDSKDFVVVSHACVSYVWVGYIERLSVVHEYVPVMFQHPQQVVYVGLCLSQGV